MRAMIDMDETDQTAAPTEPRRDAMQAIRRGLAGRCPSCGEGAMFRRYLKVSDTCPSCGEELHHQRADDAPPYFTMVIVGHVVVGGVLILEKAYAPETWVHLSIWLPLTIIMSLALLQPIKGALVGLQWAFRMHGFGGADAEPDADLEPSSPHQ